MARFEEFKESHRDNIGFVVTCIFNKPMFTINSKILKANVLETLLEPNLILKSIMKKLTSTQDLLFINELDNILTELINDYLATNFPELTISSYIEDYPDVIDFLIGSSKYGANASKVFAKECDTAISNFIWNGYNSLNEKELQNDDRTELKDTSKVVYIDAYTLYLGLDDLQDKNIHPINIEDPNNLLIKLCVELNKGGDSTKTFLIATKDNKLFRVIESFTGKFYIKRYYI